MSQSHLQSFLVWHLKEMAWVEPGVITEVSDAQVNINVQYHEELKTSPC